MKTVEKIIAIVDTNCSAYGDGWWLDVVCGELIICNTFAKMRALALWKMFSAVPQATRYERPMVTAATDIGYESPKNSANYLLTSQKGCEVFV